jgi:hypothetical protein
MKNLFFFVLFICTIFKNVLSFIIGIDIGSEFIKVFNYLIEGITLSKRKTDRNGGKFTIQNKNTILPCI